MTDLLTKPNFGSKVFRSILVLARSLECVYNNNCPVKFSTICILINIVLVLIRAYCLNVHAYMYSDLLLDFRFCIVMPLLNL